MARSVAEYGASPSGNAIVTCGPHTGHFFRPVAFCEDETLARLLSATPDLVDAGERLLAVFDQQKMTTAERIIVGISDAALRTEGTAAIDALRAAIARATGGAA